MVRFILALPLLLAASISARAACDSMVQTEKYVEVSKLVGNPDRSPQAKAVQDELQPLFLADPTEETCAKLDALLERAKAL